MHRLTLLLSALLPFLIPSLISFPDISAAEKQQRFKEAGQWTSTEIKRSPPPASAKMGIRAEEGAQHFYTVWSRSLQSENPNIWESASPPPKTQKQPPFVLSLPGKHTNYAEKTNLGYVSTKLVDEQRHMLHVLSNMPGVHAIQQLDAYSDPSQPSPEPTCSPPGQLTPEFFSWNILLLYGDTMTEGTVIF